MGSDGDRGRAASPVQLFVVRLLGHDPGGSLLRMHADTSTAGTRSFGSGLLFRLLPIT